MRGKETKGRHTLGQILKLPTSFFKYYSVLKIQNRKKVLARTECKKEKQIEKLH